MSKEKNRRGGWGAPLIMAAALAVMPLTGCADALFLDDPNPASVKALKDAIQLEFDRLTREFDRLDGEGDLELCAPVPFAVARFAVYQVVEERRSADMASLARFVGRARAAIGQAQAQMRERRCADADGDGLTNLAEARLHRTRPDAADTDGDSLLDGAEVRRHRTNPLKADTDGDLLEDGREIALGLSPLLADSDGDGFADGLEVALGANPRDTCSQPRRGERSARRHRCRGRVTHPAPRGGQRPARSARPARP